MAYYYILEKPEKFVNESRKVSIGNQPIFIHFKEGKVLKKCWSGIIYLKKFIHNSVFRKLEYTPSKLIHNINKKMYMNDGKPGNLHLLHHLLGKWLITQILFEKFGKEKGNNNIEVGILFFYHLNRFLPEIKKENDDFKEE